MYAIIASLAVVLLIVLVAALAGRERRLRKIAVKFITRKGKLTVLSILALVVGSSIVTGSLAVGDSMENAIVERVFSDLGNVDVVVTSSGLFNVSVYENVSADTGLAGMIDATAPLLMLRGSTRNRNSGALSNANLIGYDQDFFDLGAFETTSGNRFADSLSPGEAVLNQNLADKLGASANDVITIATRSPDFTVESIYAYRAGQVMANVTVRTVVKDVGLGRLSLETSSVTADNLFLDLTYLQGLLQANDEVNTILVSNTGDAQEGVDLSEEVALNVQRALDEAIGYRDVDLSIDAFNYVRIESENVFFAEEYLSWVQGAEIEAVSPVATYFVNNISFGTTGIAYSTVTGLDPQTDYAFGPFFENSTAVEIVGDIGDDEMIITNYTAQRLGAGIGDNITLNYTIYTRAYTQVFRYATFTVAQVVDITGKAHDPNLMPAIPGIRGEESCGDWEPPWMSGDDMRKEMVSEDLRYWTAYGGTPKTYITLDRAKELWSNDLGSLTAIKIKGNVSALPPILGSNLNSSIAAGDAGIVVSQIKKQGIESASGVQLLTETFLSFGAVAVIAGMVLVAGLVGVIMEDRRREIGTLGALGYRRGQITGVFAIEALVLSLIAAAIGIAVGILVAGVSIWLTNTYWTNIVEGTTVTLYFTLDTLVIGYTAGVFLSFLAFTIFAYWASRVPIVQSLREVDMAPAERHRLPKALVGLGVLLTVIYFVVPMDPSIGSLAVLGGPVFIALFSPFILKGSLRKPAVQIGPASAIAITLVVDLYFVATLEGVPFMLFFASGFTLVIILIIWLSVNLKNIPLLFAWYRAESRYPIVSKLALLSPTRRVRRTALAITLFAVVIFTFLGLSANISGQQANLEQIVEHQGAGYDVIAESSVPLRFDLGNPQDRAENNLSDFPQGVSVVQFLTYGQPGGSCSNLRKNLPPKLIGANATFVAEGKMGFEIPRGASTWSELDEVRTDGWIPAVGDMNTVIWILGKNVGDTVEVTDEYGDTRSLVIVGILENSIFPGAMFVSEDNLDELHPTTAEYDLFLFKTADSSELMMYLESALQAYGMDAELVDGVVEENLAIEWSYMGLFQAFLLFGLFVGILGLAAFSSRSVEERRHEIGTMKSLGIQSGTVSGIFLLESLYIALLGSIVGIVAGLLVSFTFFGKSSIVGYGAAVPWLALVAVLVIVIVASLLATLLPARRAASLHPAEALKRDK